MINRVIDFSEFMPSTFVKPGSEIEQELIKRLKEQQDGTDCNTCQLQDEPACDEICTSKATLIAKIVEQRSDLAAVKEELEYVLRDWNDLVRAIGAKTNGTAIGEAKRIVLDLAAEREKVKRLEKVREAAEMAILSWDGGRDCHSGYMEQLSETLFELRPRKY